MSSILTLMITRHDGRAVAACTDGSLFSLSFPAAMALLGELRDAAVIRHAEFTPTVERFLMTVPNAYGDLLEAAAGMVEVTT